MSHHPVKLLHLCSGHALPSRIIFDFDSVKADGKVPPGRPKTWWLDDITGHLSLTGILPHKGPDLVQNRTSRRHIMHWAVLTLSEQQHEKYPINQVDTSRCSVPAAQRLHPPVCTSVPHNSVLSHLDATSLNNDAQQKHNLMVLQIQWWLFNCSVWI